ncbi:helix-turn-helix domain-containing protein [Nocardia amamiensis]|uniref:helix-turn-helix domain-containing protein n=1 Tax=Nocardia amamiensis TaxID=404578 RepID=UPI00147231C6
MQLLRDYGSLRVMDAAAHLDISRSSAHRLLQTLAYRGVRRAGRHPRLSARALARCRSGAHGVDQGVPCVVPATSGGAVASQR